MRVLVLGAAGQIGAWTVEDLVDYYDAEVVAADLSLERVKTLAKHVGKGLVHWLIVLAVAGSWATHYAGVEWFAWHRRLGYTVLVLVAFRIVWGFAGTRHARFGHFLRGPRAILDYLLGRTTERPVGHNPVGALGVVALLGVLFVQAATRLVANDEIINAGPFYGWISPELSNAIASVHRINSKVLLVLIGAHLMPVAWYALVRRQRLAARC